MLKFSIFVAVLAVFIISVSSEQDSSSDSSEEAVSGNGCAASCHEPKSAQDNCGMNLNLRRWHFNSQTKECESFQYGGCSGNSNRFGSKDSCMHSCGGCRGQNMISSSAARDREPTCDCKFFKLGPYKGGCRIMKAPPQGYKCECVFQWFEWICFGNAVKCTAREICPANCVSKECCQRGIGQYGGDCEGYEQPTSGSDSSENDITKDEKSLPNKLEDFKRCISRINHRRSKDLIVDQNSNATYYEILSHQWNLRKIKVDPIAYFVPTTNEDVEDAVKCGVESNIPLTPRSGGHSYEAWSFGADNSIVIDFRNMDQISINPSDDTAIIGPGALLGPVLLKLYLGGGYTLPVGNCFTVGLGGHAIGGGFGLMSNLYGLTLDTVLEQKMVDASGKTHVASQTQNPDLYWALRGVGPGYIGIITSFKLKLIKVNQAKMTFALLNYKLTHAEYLLKTWEKWLQWKTVNDPTVFSSIFLTGKDFKSTNEGQLAPVQAGFEVHAIHIQNGNDQPLDSKVFVKGITDIWPKVMERGMIKEDLPYLAVAYKTSYTPIVRDNYSMPITPAEILNLKYATALPRYFKEKSFYVNKKMSSSDFSKIAKVIQRIPDRSVWVLIASESGFIHNVSKSATSYVHRSASYSISAQYEGSDDEAESKAGLRWLDEFMEACEPLDNGQTYQNYPDDDLIPNNEYLKRFYGSNLERLQSVKQMYDSKNYFQGPASIPVSQVQDSNESDDSVSAGD